MTDENNVSVHWIFFVITTVFNMIEKTIEKIMSRSESPPPIYYWIFKVIYNDLLLKLFY